MRNRIAAIGLALALAALPACARKTLVMELSGTVMYEKPAIESVSHVLSDLRESGGGVDVTVTLVGDPGLAASFDISPDIARGAEMSEVEAGRYVGRFTFPENTVGGPFSVLARVSHEQAGEVVMRDPEPITIPLLDRFR